MPLNATTRHISSRVERKTNSPPKYFENRCEELSTKISVKFWKKNSGIVPTSDTTVINNSVFIPE